MYTDNIYYSYKPVKGMIRMDYECHSNGKRVCDAVVWVNCREDANKLIESWNRYGAVTEYNWSYVIFRLTKEV